MIRVGMPLAGCDSGRSGIGRYAAKLAAEFATDPGVELELIGHPNERDAFDCPNSNWIDCPSFGGSALAEIVTLDAWLPRLAKHRGWDLCFAPAANRRVPRRMPCPVIGTVHDLNCLSLSGKYDPIREFYVGRVLLPRITRLQAAITVSRYSADDLITRTDSDPAVIHVVANGVDHNQFKPRGDVGEIGRLRSRYRIEAPFLLYVSRLEHPGKNHALLIRAFDRWKQLSSAPHRLVLAGPDWDRSDQIYDEINRAIHRDSIIRPGFVEAGDLPALYRHAELFVFPSLAEGFGLPLLEAMASGTAVLSANTTSLPEVAGTAASYFDPTDEDDLVRALAALLDSPDRREALVEAGLRRSASFSWSRCADETLTVFARHLDDRAQAA